MRSEYGGFPVHRSFRFVPAALAAWVAFSWAPAAVAVSGYADSHDFRLDTRTFTGRDSPLFRLDTRLFGGRDSPLFTLDTRVLTTVAARRGGSRIVRCSPTPFNPSTRIEFVVAAPGPVDVAVFDLRGRRVRQLLERVHFEPGSYSVTWRGRGPRGRDLASGLYFVHFSAGGGTDVRTVTLVR